jgi:hypothetical protein
MQRDLHTEKKSDDSQNVRVTIHADGYEV